MSAENTWDDSADARMPLWEHLDVLRKSLFRTLLYLCVAIGISWTYVDKIMIWLEAPLLKVLPEGQKYLYFTGIADKFFIYMKVAIYCGLFMTSPLILNEVWKFVSPALYKKEKKVVFPLLFATWIAFVVGGTFSYYVVIPYGYDFLIKFGTESDRPMITLTEYFSLTTQLIVALGVVFELPVAMCLLVRFNILEVKTIAKFRGTVYVGMAVIAAVVTPTPDAFTMLLVFIPLCILFEISLLASRYFARV